MAPTRPQPSAPNAKLFHVVARGGEQVSSCRQPPPGDPADRSLGVLGAQRRREFAELVGAFVAAARIGFVGVSVDASGEGG